MPATWVELLRYADTKSLINMIDAHKFTQAVRPGNAVH